MSVMKRVIVYVGSDKDSMYGIGETLGLNGDALSMFRHLGSEVKLTYNVNLNTGRGELILVDGRLLGKKVV